MMKNSKKLILVSVVSFMLGAVSVVGAEDTYREITATINDNIKMTLNGKVFAPKDSDGNAIRPIIYNGSSYLPVRALCDAIKLPINWDDKTQTIILGVKNANGDNLTELSFTKGGMYGEVAKSLDAEALNYSNDGVVTNFKSGLVMKATIGPDNVDGSWGFGTSNATFNLNKRYEKLSFNAWASIRSRIIIKDKDKDIELKRIDLNANDLKQKIEISVGGVNSLEIITVVNNVEGKAVIADAYLK